MDTTLSTRELGRRHFQPAPDDPFDAGEIPAYGDGDWPEWPALYELEWLPDDALALGSRDVSVLNSEFVEFAPEREQVWSAP